MKRPTEKARKMREGVSSDYESAMEKITIARAVEGEIAVKSAAYALKADPQVKLGSKSIMGMMVPKVEAERIHTKMTEKGYGVISTSAYIEEAAAAFEKLLDTLGIEGFLKLFPFEKLGPFSFARADLALTTNPSGMRAS